MAADVFGTYLVVSMGLFTVTSIIIGYFLLNSAVVNAARGSAYYTYIRLAEGISSSIKSSSSSVTNLNIYPKYLIFSAYFKSEDDIYYNTQDGINLFMYGIPRDDRDMFMDIKDSIQSSYNNKGMPSRQELSKCVGLPCLCIADLDSELVLTPDHFNPIACVDICWGENITGYNNLIESSSFYISENGLPHKIISDANTKMVTQSNLNVNTKCRACVEYINTGDYSIIDNKNYAVMVTPFNLNLNNVKNLAKLANFSEKTKFSFLTNIIECTSFKDLIEESGNDPDSLAFVFNDLVGNGTFVFMKVKENSILKLISFEYTALPSSINPTKSYTMTSLVKCDKLKNDAIFGGQ
jgi:hypothetical protein